MKKAKFSLGDKVKFVGDKDTDAGEVLGFSYSADRGFVYQISSTEVDLNAKKIINGVKNCTEEELVAVK